MSFLLESTAKQSNLEYKPLMDTCPDQTFSNETQFDDDKSEIPDSLALQFENKIKDCFIVPETPPDNPSPASKKTPQKVNFDLPSSSNSLTQTNDFDLLKDCADLSSQKKLSPEDNFKQIKKKLEYDSKLENETSRIDDPIDDPIVKKSKLSSDIDMILSDDNNTTKSQVDTFSVSAKNKIKKEKVKIKKENESVYMEKMPILLTKLDLDVVYSKKKPPAHSIKKEVNLAFACYLRVNF